MKGTSPSKASRASCDLRCAATGCHDEEVEYVVITHLRGEIMPIVTVGIDLEKNVFAVHSVGETANAGLARPEVPRATLLEVMANLRPCLTGIEACCFCQPAFAAPGRLDCRLDQALSMTTSSCSASYFSASPIPPGLKPRWRKRPIDLKFALLSTATNVCTA